jgi:hypothetical protein
MSRPEDKLCENCVYWEALEGPRETLGSCHRHAPMPVLHDAWPDTKPARDAWWPLTAPDDWCGEWKEQS